MNNKNEGDRSGEVELKIVADYGTDRIDASVLNTSNYISTDNLLPERGGITNSDYLPTKGKVSKFNIGDTLVSNIRPYFKKIWYAKETGGCSNDVIVFKPKTNKIDPKYLYYQLSKGDFFDFMMSGANGTKMPRGNKKSIPTFRLLLPSIPTQKRIASILSAYDDLIENNLKRIKLLEELAQRTYEEWFVKFTINGEQLPIDEKTGLPDGWERKSLSAIGDITSSKRIFLSEYVENGIPFYRSKEIIQKYNFENIDSPLFITEKKYYEIKNKFGEPKQGDFLITAVGTLGYVHLVNEKDGEFYFKDGNLIWIKNIKNKLLIPMMFFRFRSSEFKNYLNSIAIGSSQKALTIESMKRIELVIPTKEIQLSFDLIANPLLNQIYNIATQNQKLKESRDILLPKLMNGTLNIAS